MAYNSTTWSHDSSTKASASTVGTESALTLTGDLTVSTIKNYGNDVTIDSSGDIVLNADGGDVTIADGSASDFWKVDALNRRLYLQHDDNNWFKIEVDANGQTTISTYDQGVLSGGHLAINSDGQINLQSINGATSITSSSTITLDSGTDIVLDADGDQVSIKFGGATGQIDFTNENSGDGVIQQKINAKDLVIKQYDGTEVARFKDNLDTAIAANLVVTGQFACNGQSLSAAPDWTVSNKSGTPRTLDANGTLAEIGDNLAQLVDDLISIGILQ